MVCKLLLVLLRSVPTLLRHVKYRQAAVSQCMAGKSLEADHFVGHCRKYLIDADSIDTGSKVQHSKGRNRLPTKGIECRSRDVATIVHVKSSVYSSVYSMEQE